MIHVYDKKTFAQLRKSQYDAFNQDAPGSWFERASDLIINVPDDTAVLALGVTNGDAVVFDKNGKALRRVKEREQRDPTTGEITVVEVDAGVLKQGHRGWLVDLNGDLVGCSPVVSEFGGFRYASGMMIVTGRGNSGKTPLIHALGAEMAGEEGYATIRFGEPLSGYNTDFDLFISEVAYALLHHRVIVIDSLKNVIGAAGGNATSGGISRGAFDLLSDLGSLAASRGCVVIASLNPTSNDAKIVELVNEAVRSNSTSLAIAMERENEWQILTRTGEGLQRLTHTLHTEYADHSVLRILKTEDRGSSTRSTKIGQVVIKNEELEATLRRLTAN